MSTKTITLSEDAYQRLVSLKQTKESFSDVVRRITTKKPLTAFAGLLTETEATKVEKAIQKGRARSRERALKLKSEFQS
ncbi:hypothetical protein COV18_02430 [Candidatus Woesearchaeota archaeon CG10_big_fil_rev_8_21_14_0_10_37_12]|nr:MAG: hypothetical protein COV18_02430 [Candidatus Woesearchaeota archaeon CG10_big_fil_rev_8_21_14_0_10_37_12]